jgi:hypothetical protein
MEVFKEVMIMNVLVLKGGWAGCIAVKMIPATMADKPAQRMSFGVVTFIFSPFEPIR